MEKLIEAGGKVNINSLDSDGNSPLLLATERGDFKAYNGHKNSKRNIQLNIDTLSLWN